MIRLLLPRKRSPVGGSPAGKCGGTNDVDYLICTKQAPDQAAAARLVSQRFGCVRYTSFHLSTASAVPKSPLAVDDAPRTNSNVLSTRPRLRNPPPNSGVPGHVMDPGGSMQKINDIGSHDRSQPSNSEPD